jgi:hypothetical protein
MGFKQQSPTQQQKKALHRVVTYLLDPRHVPPTYKLYKAAHEFKDYKESRGVAEALTQMIDAPVIAIPMNGSSWSEEGRYSLYIPFWCLEEDDAKD